MIPKDIYYAQRGSLAEQKFYQFLIDYGYPQQVLRPESVPVPQSRDWGADFFVLAPGLSSDFLAAFEVKARLVLGSIHKERLAQIADRVCHDHPGCVYYLVVVDAEMPTAFQYDERKREFVRSKRIPTYDELTAGWLRRVSYVDGIRLHNVTVFKSLRLNFARGLNVFIGENGFGKSTLLRLLYGQAKWATESALRDGVKKKDRDGYVESVFGLPARSLIARQGDADRALIETRFSGLSNGVSFVNLTRSGVRVGARPLMANPIPSVVFLQAHEILSAYRGYASLWARYAANMSRDGTIIDTVNLLSLPALRSIPKGLADVCAGLEKSIGGRIELDEKEETFFFVEPKKGGLRTPIDLTAEGWRKIGQLLILLRNGAIAPGSVLIWDEPEANLNPKLEKVVAALLVGIARSGVQVFIATHSLFLANEFDIALRTEPLETGARFINLKKGGRVDVGDSLSEIDGITLIEESMSQSDRYMELD